MYMLGQGSSPRKDKENGPPLRVTLRTIPWKMISIKKKKDKGRHGNI